MDKLEDFIFDQMRKSYEAKMKELPPPPPGYWYKPGEFSYHKEGESIIVDVDLTLEPIIQP